jgi:hypothetical protein
MFSLPNKKAKADRTAAILSTIVSDDILQQAALSALRSIRTRLGIENDGRHARAFLDTIAGEEIRALLLRYIAREVDNEACQIEARLDRRVQW